MEYKDILLKKEDGVAVVTLNRPEALNALSMEIREGIGTFFQDFRTDDSVRAVIITGAGRAFCAGADVKKVSETHTSMSAVEMRGFIRDTIDRAVLAVTTLEKPVIAMVNGVATGAGCAIAMLCDLIIASDKARFGMAFVRLGVTPDWGAGYFLTRRVGPIKAKELLFTGELISAEEAERIGLVNHVVPAEQLESAVMVLAQKLAHSPTRAIGAAKTLVNRSLDMDLMSFLEYEAYATPPLFQTEDHKEGVRAFIEKREPEFKGR